MGCQSHDFFELSRVLRKFDIERCELTLSFDSRLQHVPSLFQTVINLDHFDLFDKLRSESLHHLVNDSTSFADFLLTSQYRFHRCLVLPGI